MAELLKYEDCKNMDAKAIDAKVSELRREMFNLRMQKAAAGVEKPHVFKANKKTIARLLTVKNASK